MTSFTLLRGRERQAQPWKNGGGFTSEVAVFPCGAGLDMFDWRVSIATVSVSGPFSCFSGVDRILAVIDGQLDLHIDDPRSTIRLAPDSLSYAFPGDIAVTGEPVGGPATDLNLMIHRGRWKGAMERIASPCSHRLAFGSGCAIILFTGEGSMRCRDDVVAVQPFDALHMEVTNEPILLDSGSDVYIVSLTPCGL
jgi:environmental stress-induced protein Ves